MPFRERLDRRRTLDALEDIYETVAAFAASLDEAGQATPSRCEAWTVRDLLFHMLLDSQRALVAFASPSDEPPDTDFVEYWRPFSPDSEWSGAHARFVVVSAAAYGSGERLERHRVLVAGAAVRAARASSLERITTQGHVLEVADFVATLVVEAAVHYVDLTEAFPNEAPPPASGLDLVALTLDGLLDAPRPAPWDDFTYLLKGTGRLPLSPEDRELLGQAANLFPLFG